MRKSLALKLLILSSLMFCFLAGISPNKLYAAEGELSVEYLTGFAFFKFAKVEPDFATWVRHSDAYKNGSPAERSEMIRLGVPSLENQFANHVIANNPITIKTKATFIMPGGRHIKKMLAEDKIISIPIKLMNQSGSYFALQIADMWIAMIPKDLEHILDMKLTEEQFANFKKAMSDAGLGGKAEPTLKMTLMPRQADTQAPLKVENFELWMLMADITNLEIWSADGKTMAWYMEIPGQEKNKVNTDVYNLFKN